MQVREIEVSRVFEGLTKDMRDLFRVLPADLAISSWYVARPNCRKPKLGSRTQAILGCKVKIPKSFSSSYSPRSALKKKATPNPEVPHIRASKGAQSLLTDKQEKSEVFVPHVALEGAFEGCIRR